MPGGGQYGGVGGGTVVGGITIPPSGGGGGVSIAACMQDAPVVGRMRKNTAGQKVGVQMVTASDGSAFTSTVTVHVTIDAGTQAMGSVGSGVCTHEGNGYHTYAPAQAETNGDQLAYTFVGSGAVPKTVQVYTISYDPHDVASLGLSRLDATIGSRATQTSVDAVDDFVDTEVAAILAAVDTEVGTLLSRMGTPSDLGSGATLSANLSDIEAQTDDIGAAGAGLTAIS